MFAKIERFVFFPVVRITAFLGALALLAATIFGLVFLLTFKGIQEEDIQISFSDLEALAEPKAEEKTGKVIIPPYVKEDLIEWVFDGDEAGYTEWFNYMEEENWSGFETAKQTTEYYKQLSRIIAEAEKKKKAPEEILNYIQLYGDLYSEKYNEKSAGTNISLGLGNRADEMVSTLASTVKQAAIDIINSVLKGVVAFAVLALFIIFSLLVVILSLLSIERNTRKEG
jgi:hypothetical protein